MDIHILRGCISDCLSREVKKINRRNLISSSCVQLNLGHTVLPITFFLPTTSFFFHFQIRCHGLAICVVPFGSRVSYDRQVARVPTLLTRYACF